MVDLEDRIEDLEVLVRHWRKLAATRLEEIDKLRKEVIEAESERTIATDKIFTLERTIPFYTRNSIV